MPKMARAVSRGGLGQRGMSLMETMVAVGLFVVSAATTNSFLVQQIRQSSQNNLYTVAYAVAEEQLESVRAARYPDMAASTAQVQKGAVVFDVATSVETNVPAPNLKRITVNVGWNEPGGRRDVEVKTIFTAVRRF